MYETLFILLIAVLISLESERAKPKPVPLGGGDTLMVRITGYGFCPPHCDVNHNHIGHYKNYNCEELQCEHITINEKWSRKINNDYLVVCYGIFYLWYMGKCTIYSWFNTCICFNDNGTH